MKLCLLRIRANSTIPKKMPTTKPPTPATIGQMKSGLDDTGVPGPAEGRTGGERKWTNKTILIRGSQTQ